MALAVDVMTPTSSLVDAMQVFEEEFPTVPLRLHVEALGAVTQLVHSGVASYRYHRGCEAILHSILF